MFPGLAKRKRCVETAVVHHTVLQRCIVDDLFAIVESFDPIEDPRVRRGSDNTSGFDESKQPFWMRMRNIALGGRCDNFSPGAEVDSSTRQMPVSEYELYFAFAWRFHRDRVHHRPLDFAVTRDWKRWALMKGKNSMIPPEVTPSPSPCNSIGNCGSSCIETNVSDVTYVVSHSHLHDQSLSLQALALREGVIRGSKSRSQSKAPLSQEAAKLSLFEVLLKHGTFDS